MSATKVSIADVTVSNEGSMYLFVLHTSAGRTWVSENAPVESWQWLGSRAFAVDHHCAENLAMGMTGDGLVVR